jgi:hypothetical protein
VSVILGVVVVQLEETVEAMLGEGGFGALLVSQLVWLARSRDSTPKQRGEPSCVAENSLFNNVRTVRSVAHHGLGVDACQATTARSGT